jgi:hypothetical protein
MGGVGHHDPRHHTAPSGPTPRRWCLRSWGQAAATTRAPTHHGARRHLSGADRPGPPEGKPKVTYAVGHQVRRQRSKGKQHSRQWHRTVRIQSADKKFYLNIPATGTTTSPGRGHQPRSPTSCSTPRPIAPFLDLIGWEQAGDVLPTVVGQDGGRTHGKRAHGLLRRAVTCFIGRHGQTDRKVIKGPDGTAA